MKKYTKALLMVALIGIVAMATAAFAQGAGNSSLFGTAQTTLASVFKNVRIIVFILGGFALVGFAIAAIFGKLDWKKVAILAVGLALLAVADQVVSYAIKASGGNTDSITWDAGKLSDSYGG